MDSKMGTRIPIPNSAESRAFVGIVVAALALGLVRRLLFGLETPLWLDEAFTGAIAIQPTFRGLIQDCLWDVPGPIHYAITWGWEKLFGASNISLRLPSLLFGIAAPLLIMFKGHPDKQTRLIWAALAALWIPGFTHATDARAYSLLFLLGVAQIILFMRMLVEPTTRNAAFWCGLSALFLLTHYHSALVTGLQGLGYIIVRRKEALRTWPAALLFAPAVAWMIFHLPLVYKFSTPEVAWQKLLRPIDVLYLPDHLIGAPRFSREILGAILGLTAWEAWLRLRERSLPSVGRFEALAVAASIIAILIVFGLGFLRPNYTPRYLIPFMPGALLGAAIWTRVLAQRLLPLPWLVLSGMIVLAAWEMKIRASGSNDWRSEWSWEAASRDLAEAGARRLIFTWDHPTAAIIGPPLMARVGSFFFDRERLDIPTKLVRLSPTDDPNKALLAAADRPGDGIIWKYHLNTPTLASRHPPALEELDPTLKCRRYSKNVVACLRSGSQLAAGSPNAPGP